MTDDQRHRWLEAQTLRNAPGVARSCLSEFVQGLSKTGGDVLLVGVDAVLHHRLACDVDVANQRGVAGEDPTVEQGVVPAV